MPNDYQNIKPTHFEDKTTSWLYIFLYILTMVILFSTVFYSRDFVKYTDFIAVEHRVDNLESKLSEVNLLLKLTYPERQRVLQHDGNRQFDEKQQIEKNSK